MEPPTSTPPTPEPNQPQEQHGMHGLAVFLLGYMSGSYFAALMMALLFGWLTPLWFFAPLSIPALLAFGFLMIGQEDMSSDYLPMVLFLAAWVVAITGACGLVSTRSKKEHPHWPWVLMFCCVFILVYARSILDQ